MTHSSPTGPRLADDNTCKPFRNQIATAPLEVLRQSRSLLPSPSKSPVTAMAQALGTAPRLPDCETWSPFTSQIATVPVLPSRQTMSLLPSPLDRKSVV